MYWIWVIFTSSNEYLLDRDLVLVAKSTDCDSKTQTWMIARFVVEMAISSSSMIQVTAK